MPSALGMVAWIIMAPEMLAKASRSLPWRTQISAFMISGSSVATGASSAARCGEAPMATPSVSIWLTNTCDAPAITTSASTVCVMAQDSAGSVSRGAASGSRSSLARLSSSLLSSRFT